MKKIFLFTALSSILWLTGCKKNEDNNDTNAVVPSCNSEEEIYFVGSGPTGKVSSADFSYQTSRVEFINGNMVIRLMSEGTDDCGVDVEGRADRVDISIKEEDVVIDEIFNFNGNEESDELTNVAAFVHWEEEDAMTPAYRYSECGAINITEIDTTSETSQKYVSGRVTAYADDENYISGTFKAIYCPIEE